MTENHRKVLSNAIVDTLNSIYSFEYDDTTNTIITHLSTCKRITIHDAKKPIIIICPRLGRKKIILDVFDIDVWKTFKDDKALSKYSLFDVHNAVSKLKVTYQEVDLSSISRILKSKF